MDSKRVLFYENDFEIICYVEEIGSDVEVGGMLPLMEEISKGTESEIEVLEDSESISVEEKIEQAVLQMKMEVSYVNI